MAKENFVYKSRAYDSEKMVDPLNDRWKMFGSTKVGV